MKVDLVLAPNPSLLTGPGTNTWVVSSGEEAIVIDPGPMIAEHLEAIREALRGLVPTAVLVTHTHPDHAPAANGLAAEFGAPTVGSAPGPDFRPDRTIADGESVEFGATAAMAIATPGHTPDSTCYRIDDALFTGDHIMGGSTVIVEDMADYMASLRAVRGIGVTTIYPGHGPVVDEPDTLIAEYIAHRQAREAQILAAVRQGADSVGEVVETVYHDVDRALHPPAALSVSAHLRKLADEGVVVFPDPGSGWAARVEPTS